MATKFFDWKSTPVKMLAREAEGRALDTVAEALGAATRKHIVDVLTAAKTTALDVLAGTSITVDIPKRSRVEFAVYASDEWRGIEGSTLLDLKDAIGKLRDGRDPNLEELYDRMTGDLPQFRDHHDVKDTWIAVAGYAGNDLIVESELGTCIVTDGDTIWDRAIVNAAIADAYKAGDMFNRGA